MSSWVVKFIVSEDEVSEVDLKLGGIRAVDSSFRYSMKKLKDGRFLLKIYSDSKDDAYKKGLWIRDKVFGNDRFFKVEKLK